MTNYFFDTKRSTDRKWCKSCTSVARLKNKICQTGGTNLIVLYY